MAPLTDLIISSIGDVGKSNDMLKRWITGNGGRWTPKVAKGITHLICSKDAYKQNLEPGMSQLLSPPKNSRGSSELAQLIVEYLAAISMEDWPGDVQQAKKFGAFVVSYDWLEDSLTSRRHLVERKYTWEVLREQRRNRKAIKRLGPKSDAKKFNAGCDLAKEDTGSGTSRKSSSWSGGFFTSALEDLKRKREAREKEEEARQAEAVKSIPALQTATEDAVPATRPAKPRSTPKLPASVLKTHTQTLHQAQKSLQYDARAVSAEQTKDGNTSPSPLTPTAEPTPAPSLFPPCLKYTPPSSTSRPPPISLPPYLNTPTPTTTAPKPANQKLEDLYHIFLDATGFEYKLMLLRSNPYLNNFARYDIRLYESHTKPHVYCTFVRYVPPAGQPVFLPVADTNTPTPSAPPPVPVPPQAAPPSTTSPSAHPELVRLHALIAPPTPLPTHPYRTLITPLSSPFAQAFTSFRHAFRDLTLLSWHERLDHSHSLQKLRARAFCIEPFVWRRPAEGLPIGVVPGAEARVGGAEGGDEVGYVRNRWGLPAVDVPLGREGGIGSAIFREAVEVRRCEEEKRKMTTGMGIVRGSSNAKNAVPPRYYEPSSGSGFSSSSCTTTSTPPLLSKTHTATAKSQRKPTPGPAVLPPLRGGGKGKAVFMDYRSREQKRAERAWGGDE